VSIRRKYGHAQRKTQSQLSQGGAKWGEQGGLENIFKIKKSHEQQLTAAELLRDGKRTFGEIFSPRGSSHEDRMSASK